MPALLFRASLFAALAIPFTGLCQQGSSPQELYTQAKQAQAAGDTETAIARYKQIIKEAPETSAAYNNLGLLYLNLGRFREASEVLERGLAINPRMASASALLGAALYEEGDYKAAKPRLEAALRADPADGRMRMYLARAMLKSSDAEGADRELETLVKQEPTNQEAWYLLGKTRLQLSQDAFAQVAKINPDSVLSHELAGEIMEDMKNYDGAIREYKKAVAQAPDRQGTHARLGNAYWLSGDWPNAETEFTAELKNDPADCVARWKLSSSIIEAGGDLSSALVDLDQVKQQCPDLMQARVDRARVLIKTGHPADALPELLLAEQRDPDERSIHFLLASVYRAQGQKDRERAEMGIYARLEEAARTADQISNRPSQP